MHASHISTLSHGLRHKMHLGENMTWSIKKNIFLKKRMIIPFNLS